MGAHQRRSRVPAARMNAASRRWLTSSPSPAPTAPGRVMTTSTPPPPAARSSAVPPEACAEPMDDGRPKARSATVPWPRCARSARRRCAASSSLIPGPWSTTWSATAPGVLAVRTVASEPRGEALTALSIELSSIWSARQDGRRRDPAGPPAERDPLARRQRLVGRDPVAHDLGQGHQLTVGYGDSARASTSRPSMIPARRLRLQQGQRRRRAGSARRPPRAGSSRRRTRRAARGVRSWCEASAANSRCRPPGTQRPAIVSKLPARSRTSRGQGASPSARRRSRPAGDRLGARRWRGRSRWRASKSRSPPRPPSPRA